MKQTEKEIRSYNDFVEDTGKKIMALRIKKQYTRKCLADLADISEKYLYEIEVGKKGCSSYILYRLAVALNISIDYLADHTHISYKDLEEMWENLHGYQKEMMGTIMHTIYENFQKIW